MDAHQEVQVGDVRLDVVSVFGLHPGKSLELRFGLRTQRVHEGVHPPHALGHAFPRQP